MLPRDARRRIIRLSATMGRGGLALLPRSGYRCQQPRADWFSRQRNAPNGGALGPRGSSPPRCCTPRAAGHRGGGKGDSAAPVASVAGGDDPGVVPPERRESTAAPSQRRGSPCCCVGPPRALRRRRDALNRGADTRKTDCIHFCENRKPRSKVREFLEGYRVQICGETP